MSLPIAYDPQPDWRYQLLIRCPGNRAYEHLDYARDKADKNFLLQEYRLVYTYPYVLKVIVLPKKFWPTKG